MPWKSILVLCALMLAGCDTASTPRASIVTAIGQLQPDPATAAFFIEEATQAGVADILLVHAGPGGSYGSTTMTSDTMRPVIRINVDRPGAASATNIAHEISHSAAYKRHCFNHGERWLAYHLGIAQRFEARFPGVKWSGQSPAANVAGKAARYPNDHC